MSYSRKLVTLDRIEPFLAQAQTGEIVEWQTDKPAALAYKIREGFFLTSIYPDRYPWLTELASRARVKVFSNAEIVLLFPDEETAQRYTKPNSRVLRHVRARRVAAPNEVREPAAAVALLEPDDTAPSVRTYIGESSESKNVIIPKPCGRFDIIAEWDRIQDTPDLMKKISFTNAQVSNLDLNKLSRWAAVQGWLLIVNEGMLTLLPHDPEDTLIRSLAWIPTDE